MTKRLFVVGTGTDIGKTYVTGLICKKLHDMYVNIAYYKGAMSGNVRDENGVLIPGDAKFVKEIAKLQETFSEMCPYVYERAVSPHLASRIEGNPVSLDVVKDGFLRLSEKYDYIIVEGSGGILCPICFDERRIWLEDIIKAFSAPTILIADAGLGTINSVGLTADYMKSKGIKIKGIIFNNYIDGDIMQEDNVRMCEYLTGIPVVAKVRHGDTDIDIDKDILISLFEEI